MDTAVRLTLQKAGAFSENTISKNEGSLGEKPNFGSKLGGIGWECYFWSFSERFKSRNLKKKLSKMAKMINLSMKLKQKVASCGNRMQKIGGLWVRAIKEPSGVTRGKQSGPPPQDFWLGNFCWPTGKREERENGAEKKENWKRKGGKLINGRRKSYKMSRGLFFFFFTFQNHWNLFWVYQNGNFLPGKSVSRQEKNQEKWLCPSEKYSSTPLEEPTFHQKMWGPWVTAETISKNMGSLGDSST